MEMICENSFLTDNDTGEELTENIMVAYVTVPELPEPHGPVVRKPNGAIICAYLFEDGWAFVGLSGEQKHEIGDHLINISAPMNEWIKVVVIKGER